MLVFCPTCEHSSQHELLTWDDSLIIPFVCPRCKAFTWIKREDNVEFKITDGPLELHGELPPIEEGTPVYINNHDHDFFLERGIIVDRSYVHYRVHFASKDDRIDGKRVWFPAHWIMIMPEGL